MAYSSHSRWGSGGYGNALGAGGGFASLLSLGEVDVMQVSVLLTTQMIFIARGPKWLRSWKMLLHIPLDRLSESQKMIYMYSLSCGKFIEALHMIYQ